MREETVGGREWIRYLAQCFQICAVLLCGLQLFTRLVPSTYVRAELPKLSFAMLCWRHSSKVCMYLWTFLSSIIIISFFSPIGTNAKRIAYTSGVRCRRLCLDGCSGLWQNVPKYSVSKSTEMSYNYFYSFDTWLDTQVIVKSAIQRPFCIEHDKE